ncbi:hypothetical protein QBC44DRAFT_343915 [Cladorrhinum sp. PSN332]|nr:hypothetical protein QBC44DRAFT_343915 [Cladorrhinum sp. PSN332]
MQLFNIIALLASIAAAAPTLTERDGPSGHEVEIRGFTFGGSGCPGGSVASMLSTDLTTLTLIYDEFIAQSGEGIQTKERRKNCQVNVKLHYPQGWQFSVFKADYRGHATLPSGFTGSCKATYYFSGHSQQVSRTEQFQGPIDKDYLKTDVFGVESTIWSPCGAEGLLNINSAIQLSPLDSKTPALLTSESTDLKFKQIHYLQWRKC